MLPRVAWHECSDRGAEQPAWLTTTVAAPVERDSPYGPSRGKTAWATAAIFLRRTVWAKYCAKAKVTTTIHQLRHAYVTELVNAGVSLVRQPQSVMVAGVS